VRIVSLVPSLTETLHDFGVGGSIVGVTKFCVHPETARDTAAVVGGTKDPDVPQILQLRPDLVIADEDENKPEHVDALRTAGVKVHVTRINTLGDVAKELRALGALIGRTHEAEKAAGDLQEEAQKTQASTALFAPLSCFVPIWKRPLMSIGGPTYMSDLLRIAGGRNVFGEVQKKYFEADLDEVRDRRPDAVLLPTEPYRFREPDRAWFNQRIELPVDSIRIVDGQAFTWFGTRSIGGLRTITEAVAALRAAAPQTR
jgi:ABC-type Fe3+-hydroxamate transport system substrate-binding protein